MRNIGQLDRWLKLLGVWVTNFVPVAVIALIVNVFAFRIAVAIAALIGTTAAATVETLQQKARRQLEVEALFTVPQGGLRII